MENTRWESVVRSTPDLRTCGIGLARRRIVEEGIAIEGTQRQTPGTDVKKSELEMAKEKD
jgi:hypothetical protein